MLSIRLIPLLGPALVFSKHTQLLVYKGTFEELAFWNGNHSALNLDIPAKSTQKASHMNSQPSSIVLRFDMSQNGDMVAVLYWKRKIQKYILININNRMISISTRLVVSIVARVRYPRDT